MPRARSRPRRGAREERGEPVAGGRDYAAGIPGARFVELPGADHHPWAGDQNAVLTEIERFVRDVRVEETTADRVLATGMFTDIVDSTAQAAALGDAGWREGREPPGRGA